MKKHKIRTVFQYVFIYSVLFLSFALPSVASAQDPDTPTETETETETTPKTPSEPPPKTPSDDERYAAATKRSKDAFSQGAYDLAISELETAYEIRPNPNLLYNIAFIYEKQGNISKAVAYYDRFLVAPDVDLTYRKAALDRVKVLREIVAVRTKKTDPTPPPNPQLKPTPVEQPWSTQKTLGAFLIGVGGASVLTGGVLGSLAISEHSSMESATNVETRRNLAQSTETLSLTSDIVLFSGVALGLTGTLLVLFDSPTETQPTQTTQTTLSPVLLPAGAGFSFTTDF